MYKVKEHIFGPTETIEAVIKRWNSHQMSDKILNKLVLEYNRLNNHTVPTPGQQVKIPIFFGFEGRGDLDPNKIKEDSRQKGLKTQIRSIKAELKNIPKYDNRYRLKNIELERLQKELQRS